MVSTSKAASVSLLTDQKFLVFFFSRLRRNEMGRYQDHFPFLSLCGRERNFLRCDDRPLVFTHLLQGSTGVEGSESSPELLSFCGGEDKLSAPFQPASIYMHPGSGRVYHPCPERLGGVGLIRSALAIELSPFFIYPPGESQSGQPTHFLWAGQQHVLTNELAGCFPREEEDGSGDWEVGWWTDEHLGSILSVYYPSVTSFHYVEMYTKALASIFVHSGLLKSIWTELCLQLAIIWCSFWNANDYSDDRFVE